MQIREIKRRIRAISNIQHVTGAMKMVAAANCAGLKARYGQLALMPRKQPKLQAV